MPIIHTDTLTPTSLDPHTEHQVYCGLDTCVTLEVLNELHRLFNQPPDIYSFSRALQGPYLEIMQRGFAVDQMSRAHASAELRRRIGLNEFGQPTGEGLRQTLNEFAQAVWGKPLNPRSPAQLKDFFYRAMGLPEVWISQKGERKLSTNRETLEKLEVYLYARPIIACILSIRDLSKQLEVFETEIDSDGRFRTSYNIAGTETGRPSSSSNAFGTGGNAQNIAPGLRYVFVADPGCKLGVIDLEQVEARDVGYICGVLFGDWSFLDAAEGGDLHTANSRLIWPEMPWTGDIGRDRKIAERQFYREFSFRDMSKRGGHLTDYYGTAWTMSRHLKIPLALAEEFQARFCKGNDPQLRTVKFPVTPAYPCIPRYWSWVAQELQLTNKLTTPFGRERHFFGRPNDDTTLREAIAFLPQGTTADRMNLGLWRVWKHMPQVQLLGQGYDSIIFQFPESADEGAIISEALERIRVELRDPTSGRSYIVPGEAKVGWNWGAAVFPEDVLRIRAEKPGAKIPRLNPDGLVKWKAERPDRRQRQIGLKRVML